MEFLKKWHSPILSVCWTMSYTKLNFFLTILGAITFLFDIGIDLWITFKYFQQELPVFGLLTIFFVLASTLIIQAFSYTWFKDDCHEDSLGKLKGILVLHIFLLGIFVRCLFVLKYGFQVNYDPKKKNCDETKKRAVEAMTDLSMLKCFKTYLESTPQLILQIYILMEHGQITVFQYASILVSVTSISWSTVDYQMSLRKSLPGTKGISVGAPMLSYVFYKLFTLTSWIVSIVFLLSCSVHLFTVLLVVLSLAGFFWAWKVKTDFCRTQRMEFLYRAVVGIILVFTFFNIKGQRTLVPISIYYVVRTLATSGILVFCFYLRPVFVNTLVFVILSIAVVGALGVGIFSLILYYACFHPSLRPLHQSKGDTVDGPTSTFRSERAEKFIMS
ncbi:PREDICTED: XK-related protein 9 [Nanorana parkeri]|uniref:XK-related protein 9 n=1 Tax=Nanorana parkeri TaxID=125878 RepID=UPI000854472E|nr:PREDICTED: XK-related protein 9 [Nanorana parkeri]